MAQADQPCFESNKGGWIGYSGSIETAREMVLCELRGRSDIDEVWTNPFASGITSTRWGISYGVTTGESRMSLTHGRKTPILPQDYLTRFITRLEYRYDQ